jgi:hypothetical protein
MPLIHSLHPSMAMSRKARGKESMGKRTPDSIAKSFGPYNEKGMPEDWKMTSTSLESLITQIADIALL